MLDLWIGHEPGGGSRLRATLQPGAGVDATKDPLVGLVDRLVELATDPNLDAYVATNCG
jgi:hypothetical protein